MEERPLARRSLPPIATGTAGISPPAGCRAAGTSASLWPRTPRPTRITPAITAIGWKSIIPRRRRHAGQRRNRDGHRNHRRWSGQPDRHGHDGRCQRLFQRRVGPDCRGRAHPIRRHLHHYRHRCEHLYVYDAQAPAGNASGSVTATAPKLLSDQRRHEPLDVGLSRRCEHRGRQLHGDQLRYDAVGRDGSLYEHDGCRFVAGGDDAILHRFPLCLNRADTWPWCSPTGRPSLRNTVFPSSLPTSPTE